MISSKTTGTLIKNAMRYVQAQVFGAKDVREAPLVQPFGVDANPVANLRAIYASTTAQGEKIFLGFINTDALAEAGEIRIYSVGDGDTASVWCKADGTLELNGDEDFAVLFNKLKIEFNSLKSTVTDLVGAFNAHQHATAGTGPPVSPTPIPGQIPATPPSANIDNAKNSRIKTNS